ncbi:MAG TPA: glycosyltransferase family 4 protein [Longimicrobium sp.]|jgi:glycosyltransferase involved in cell wall biosynthesis|nr:glycosyltransferase family 4 protein [Longimicrobium sp.]
MIDALFVNSGILGQRTFAAFVDQAFAGERDGIRAAQVVLTDALTTRERVVRRLLCARLWPDGAGGVKNLDLFRYRAELHAGLLAARRIRRLEGQGKRFDVLHFHRQATAYASLARMRRTPAIVSIDCTHRYLVEMAASRAEARSYLPNLRRDGEIFRAARLIVSTSAWAADSLRAEYPDCATEIAVMPNPVLLEHFDPAWAEERRARATAPGYRPRVLFMGGDFLRKGGADLVAAWRQGGFGERARLDLVTHLPVEGAADAPGVHVHNDVTAHSAAWRELWRAADVFVLPTRDEAFGTVFQEAAAAGIPAVGTRITAIPEVVLHGDTGLLVAPGDRGALAAALDRLVASAGLRLEMGARARLHIERTADPASYRAQLADALHRLAGR